MDELTIDTKYIDKDICLISLKGALGSQNVELLLNTFQDVISRGVYKFIVDLSSLNYMGSPGVGLFITLLDELEEHKGTIVFVHPQGSVKEVFKLFRLSMFYSITRTLDSAVKELKDLTR